MSSDEDSCCRNREKFRSERAENDSVQIDETQAPRSDDEEYFGPSLPPHLINRMKPVDPESGENGKNSSQTENPSRTGSDHNRDVDEGGKIIGPEIPKHLLPNAADEGSEEEPEDEDPDDSVHGPSPALMADADCKVSSYDNQFLRPKKREEESGETRRKRESWMLELPPEKAVNLGLGPRQFKRKFNDGKDCDRSGWLETPESKRKGENKKNKTNDDDARAVKQREIDERNKAMEELTRKIEKKKKRKESLLEIHRKKLKKKAKKEAKNREKEGKPAERRPFDRNVDLQVNRFDECQKRAVLKKAQLLNQRFATGENQFL